MPSLSVLRASNAAILSNLPYVPVAIFVGGTSGIGQGMAESFAKATRGNANIVIIGRNREAAEQTIARFPTPSASPRPKHEFIPCDVSLMRNVQDTTTSLLSHFPKINFVVMSPGYFTTSGRVETPEGLDRKLAVTYYSRWKFTNDLLPALLRAKSDGEEAKVVSVLAAGRGTELDADDLGLKKNYSPRRVYQQGCTYNDYMVADFARRYPALSFIHAYPGPVRTNLSRSADAPAWSRALAPVLSALVYPITISAEKSGENLINGMLNTGPGIGRIGAEGENIEDYGYFVTEDNRKKVWEHSVDATTVNS